MSRFVTALQVELQGDRKTWKLLSEFVYEDSEHGRIAVARGFETDFASVPRLPVVFDLVGAYGHAAATLHDWLYSSGLVPRKSADRIFREALRATGIARWRAWLMWAGVRLGGSSHYRDPDSF